VSGASERPAGRGFSIASAAGRLAWPLDPGYFDLPLFVVGAGGIVVAFVLGPMALERGVNALSDCLASQAGCHGR